MIHLLQILKDQIWNWINHLTCLIIWHDDQFRKLLGICDVMVLWMNLRSRGTVGVVLYIWLEGCKRWAFGWVWIPSRVIVTSSIFERNIKQYTNKQMIKQLMRGRINKKYISIFNLKKFLRQYLNKSQLHLTCEPKLCVEITKQ